MGQRGGVSFYCGENGLRSELKRRRVKLEVEILEALLRGETSKAVSLRVRLKAFKEEELSQMPPIRRLLRRLGLV